MRRIATILLAACLLSACGRGDPAPADAAPKGADTSVPLGGRSVSKPNQVVGAWAAITDGELGGIEFLKDNKAMLTDGPGGGTLTMTYSVLDDGRMSLVDAQGQTRVVRATVAGDTLELDDENSGATPQRFQRVPEGQTLAAAMAEVNAKASARAEQRLERFRALLRSGGAVIRTTDGDDQWVMALEFGSPDIALEGSMVLHAPVAGRTDALSPVRVLPVRAEPRRAGFRSDRIEMVFRTGPAVEPAGQQKVSGVVRLSITGAIDAPTITGEASFPTIWPSSRPVVLETNPAAHASTIAALTEQRGAAEREINAMREILGGRVAFRGVRTVFGVPDGEPVLLKLEYNEAGGRYDAVVTVGNRADQAAVAAIELLLGRAAVYVNLPWGEQWRLQQGDEPGMLYGLWRPNPRADFLGHGSVELTPERRWTMDEVAAERAAIESYLRDDLRSPQRFTGFIERRQGATNVTRWPVSVEMRTHPDGSVSGSVWMVAQKGGFALRGSIGGRAVTLESGAPLDGSADVAAYTNQRWSLEFQGLDPAPAFRGRLTGTRLGGGEIVLTGAPSDGPATATARLLAAIDGRAFDARTTDRAADRDDGTRFVFASGPTPGSVRGEVLGTASRWRQVPPALFEGAVVEDHGMPVLRGVVKPAPDPERARDAEPFEITLALVDGADGTPRLTGSTAPGPGNQDWFILTPTDDVPPLDDLGRARLAALRLGATAVAPVNPQPGDEALVIVQVTERDKRVGQLFYADGKYTHRNSIPAAAIHAGLATPGEVGIFRLVYGPPHTRTVEPVEQNGIASQRGTFRENNPLPTFTIERVAVD